MDIIICLIILLVTVLFFGLYSLVMYSCSKMNCKDLYLQYY